MGCTKVVLVKEVHNDNAYLKGTRKIQINNLTTPQGTKK